jgi:hypothetical protein
MMVHGLKTPEEIDIGDYALRELALAVPVSVVTTAAFAAVRATTTEALDHRAVPIPDDAILYMLHEDLHVSMFAPTFWDDLGSDFSYLGFHGFASYVGVAWAWSKRYRAFRYSRRAARRPMEQVLDYLVRRPGGRFALRTDSGGPYGVVRASLVDLGLSTGRPLVAVRQIADRKTRVRGHVIPLPGAKIRSIVSAPVAASELRGLTREAARARLQEVMDRLVTEPNPD